MERKEEHFNNLLKGVRILLAENAREGLTTVDRRTLLSLLLNQIADYIQCDGDEFDKSDLYKVNIFVIESDGGEFLTLSGALHGSVRLKENSGKKKIAISSIEKGSYTQFMYEDGDSTEQSSLELMYSIDEQGWVSIEGIAGERVYLAYKQVVNDKSSRWFVVLQ